MNSNFGFLRADWPDLCDQALRAEQLAAIDPRAACFYARRTLELAVKWLYAADTELRPPYKDDLNGRLHEPTFKSLVGSPLLAKMNIIRRHGNEAVHGSGRFPPNIAATAVRELFHVAYWLGQRYARNPESRPAPGLRFDPAPLQRRPPKPAQVTSRAQLQSLEKELAAKDEALAAAQEKSGTLEAELAALQAQVAAAKEANRKRPDTHDYDEEYTRDHYIDLLLREAGWRLDGEHDREFPVTGMPSPSGKGRVDYVLWGDDGKPLAVVEAKAAKRSARDGQRQAELYADCLESAYGQRPLIYYTNGFEHWYWDDRRYPPREVQGFHTKDELQLAIHRRDTIRPLTGATINEAIVDRYYQEHAIRRIGETFENEHQRKALLVMATGAGKTRTVVALTDLLQRCNWVKRVLFLADRTALVRQAVKAFQRHLPSSSPVNLVEDKTTESRVYVSTYPTMMNLIDTLDEHGERRFGIGHFDLVVIDEAHRSVYQKYRALFSYFDALLVGLTATPRDEVHRDTYGLFDLEPGIPTDNYSLEAAIEDEYLVPYKPIEVPLKYPQEGIRYADLSAEDQEKWEALEWDDEGSVPEFVKPDEINAWLYNTDTIDKVLKVLMTYGHTVAGGDRIGKTIIFAKNQNHADLIAERFAANYPEYKGSFARTVTHQSPYSQSTIDNFAVKERAPHIAISVDMLDTGIDIPEVLNLVFFKRVRSKTKFWQMIGRGTRLCEDLFGPGVDKEDFFIFDVCANFEFFGQNPQPTERKPPEPLQRKLFRRRVALLAGLDARPDPEGPLGEEERALRRETADLLHRIVEGMNPDNFVVRPQRQWVERYRDRSAWDHLDSAQAGDIADRLSGLPSAYREDDEAAKRFDLLILRAQLCVLTGEPGLDVVADRVCGIAEALLGQTGIPVIQEQAALLEALTEAQWWDGVTLPMLEEARVRVRGLVRLIEKSKRHKVYTDFPDELGELAELPPLPGSGQVNGERFREKVRAFLRDHEDHIAIHKLRRNVQLTATDLSELERILVDSGGFERERLEREVAKADGSLGVFVRSLVGLDRAAAKDALSGFVHGSTFTAAQIKFVELIVEYLTQHGVVRPQQLFESPFTEIAPRGPDAFFGEHFAVLEGALHHIHQRALAS